MRKLHTTAAIATINGIGCVNIIEALNKIVAARKEISKVLSARIVLPRIFPHKISLKSDGAV